MNDFSTPNDNDLLHQAREVLIRVVLWSLGVAAAFGVLSVLTGGYFVAIRAAGTALLTAAACGVLWTISGIDREQRTARTTGLVATVAAYLCLLLSLWGAGAEERLTASAFAIGLAGAAAVGGLLSLTNVRTLWAGRVGVVACALLWLTAMVGIWTYEIWTIPEEAALTWGSFALCSVLAALCLIDVTLNPKGWWRWLGVEAAVTAFVVSLGGIWKTVDLGETFYSILVTIAVVVSHANLMLLKPLEDRYRWLRIGTIYAAIATGVGVDLLMLIDAGQDGGILGRLTSAASILCGAGSLAVVVLAKYFGPRETKPVVAETAMTNRIRLVCPRCACRQSLSLGGDRCTRCGLEIEVHVYVELDAVEEADGDRVKPVADARPDVDAVRQSSIRPRPSVFAGEELVRSAASE